MAKYTVEWNICEFVPGLQDGFDSKYNLYYIAIEHTKKEWEVLYIGMTSKQTVSDRLLGNHEALKTVIHDYDEKIYIGLGRVTKKTKTDDELASIEQALISYHKPRLNAAYVKRYKGEHIIVVNIEHNDSEYGLDLDEEIILTD